jgi:hypothetical protein
MRKYHVPTADETADSVAARACYLHRQRPNPVYIDFNIESRESHALMAI